MTLEQLHSTCADTASWEGRPPELVAVPDLVRVIHRGIVIAASRSAQRVCEVGHPPTYFVPRADVRADLLEPSRSVSMCRWKGVGTYWSVRIDGHTDIDVAYTYLHPTAAYRPIAGCLAFYAQKVDECWVGNEQVNPYLGCFEGGWITDIQADRHSTMLSDPAALFR
jgi:uncharacterized protein (DUF427 family)